MGQILGHFWTFFRTYINYGYKNSNVYYDINITT